MSTPAPTPDDAAKPRRVTQGEIIMALLQRGSAQSSSVTLARNAKGDTQFEVVIRTDPDHGIETIDEANTLAQTVYDALATKYPIGGSNAG